LKDVRRSVYLLLPAAILFQQQGLMPILDVEIAGTFVIGLPKVEHLPQLTFWAVKLVVLPGRTIGYLYRMMGKFSQSGKVRSVGFGTAALALMAPFLNA
jgi:hypothetical protein